MAILANAFYTTNLKGHVESFNEVLGTSIQAFLRGWGYLDGLNVLIIDGEDINQAWTER